MCDALLRLAPARSAQRGRQPGGSDLYTNDLIDEINSYDRDAIVQQAKDFDLGLVR